MIEARARILTVHNGRARLAVLDRQEGCGRCDEPGGCRSVRIAYALRPPKSEFELPDTLGVKVGDEVVLQMPDGVALRGALASYGLGVLLMIGGAALGNLLVGGDGAAAVGAAAGLVLAVCIHRALTRSRRWRKSLNIEMRRPDAPCMHVFPET